MNSLNKRVSELFVSEPFHAFKAKEVAKRLKIPQHQYKELRTLLKELVRQGNIIRIKKNRYTAGKSSSEVTGQLQVSSQGYGFVLQDGDDIFISQKNMGKAFHKDTVCVRLFAGSAGKKPEGIVVDVLQRYRTKIVGTLRQGRKQSYVIPDDLKIHKDIVVTNDYDLHAFDGQKVVCQIDEWEHQQLSPVGHILEVLGYPEEKDVDIQSIIHGFDLSSDFPSKLSREIKNIPKSIPDKVVDGRLDLTEKIIFTIDPEDAKDFDDAVSLEKLPNENYLLGVHIADVSYYVSENSPVDKEAEDRGTSVYLVDRVIPMLPEELSNDLCSLVEAQKKLCFSVLMELNSEADVVSYTFKETVIKSKKRFTYEQVQDIITGKSESEFSSVISSMYRLSQMLINKRRKRGCIDFESLEVKVELDDDGNPIALKRRERLDSHRLVEEFMLLANETVAGFIGQKLAAELNQTLPFVYRIHDKPDQVSVDEMLKLGQAFGITIQQQKRLTPRFFQQLSERFQTHPASNVLESQLLRTMRKAQYSTENIGHFGLALKYYTHFTSPIRRYPDLMVHRLLKKYLSDNPVANITPVNILSQKCKKSTDMEIKAQEAERASIKLKQVEYLERHLGDVFEGVIARIVNFGLFVTIPEFLIDGLLHVSALDDDYYVYDEFTFSLIGTYTKKKYRLGDKITVRVSRVDRNEKLVDFDLVYEKE